MIMPVFHGYEKMKSNNRLDKNSTIIQIMIVGVFLQNPPTRKTFLFPNHVQAKKPP